MVVITRFVTLTHPIKLYIKEGEQDGGSSTTYL
jgi:hypothetical protein